ncbi:MAG TPA: prepilin peptidase, partial [Planctomycetota bacterium]|nr:prepilin peptidase [Planctomycetota bacterium]
MSESQKLVLLVSSGAAGLLIGSFLNVCIFRLPRHCMSIVKPRSRCTKCLHLIVWYDNLPVVSWLLLGGKCRSCKEPISPRYAMIELLTGALYFYAGWRVLFGTREPGFGEAALFALYAWFLGALIVCTFIDLDFRILPDEITVSGVVIGVLFSAAFPALPPLKGSLLDFVGLLLRVAGVDRVPALPGLLGNPHVTGLLDSMFGAGVGWGTIWGVGVL